VSYDSPLEYHKSQLLAYQAIPEQCSFRYSILLTKQTTWQKIFPSLYNQTLILQIKMEGLQLQLYFAIVWSQPNTCIVTAVIGADYFLVLGSFNGYKMSSKRVVHITGAVEVWPWSLFFFWVLWGLPQWGKKWLYGAGADTIHNAENTKKQYAHWILLCLYNYYLRLCGHLY
jgi:hypothetical protein